VNGIADTFWIRDQVKTRTLERQKCGTRQAKQLYDGSLTGAGPPFSAATQNVVSALVQPGRAHLKMAGT